MDSQLKYSILVCAYENCYQFANFLATACRQDFDSYEIIVVDNASPSGGIYQACVAADCMLGRIKYFCILECDKKCANITQGINAAAEIASGQYVVIVADSNVLLSYNLLSEIDKLIDPNKIIISGKGTDIKISPNGKQEMEYTRADSKQMATECDNILKKMGWPNDPMRLELIDGKHRYPPPHNAFDVYVVAMSKPVFFEGPYNTNLKYWGDYHSNFVQAKCKKYGHKRLDNVKIIHQFHRVWKNDQAA